MVIIAYIGFSNNLIVPVCLKIRAAIINDFILEYLKDYTQQVMIPGIVYNQLFLTKEFACDIMAQEVY